MWENLFNERTDSPTFLGFFRSLKKFQIFVIMGIRIFVIVTGRMLVEVAHDALGDNYLAEDAVHEAFIKVALNMGKVGDVNTQETKRYLITITQNATVDIYRKRSTRMRREIFVDELKR